MNKNILCDTAYSLLLVAGLASAEQTATGSPASSANSEKLEEIVVTATRRSESVEKVPISIEALGKKDLAENGVKGIDEIAAMVPGLQFQANGYSLYANYTTIAIRGFNTIVGASTVGIYLDDTPLQGRMSTVGNTGFSFPMTFDLDRVEVARGPQGTLFGASSESGTLRFISNQPSLTDFSGFTHEELSFTQNGAPSYEIGAAAGGPILQDELGFRVSAWDRRDGGFIDTVDPITGNITGRNLNSDEKKAFKAALAFQANQDTLVTPTIYYQSAEVGNSNMFYPLYSDPSTDHFANGRLLPDTSTDDLLVSSLKVESHLSFADLTFNGAYTHRTFDESADLSTLNCAATGGCGSPLGIAYPSSSTDVSPTGTGQRLRTSSEEVRLTSNQPDAFFTWVAGIFNDNRNQVDYQTVQGPLDIAGPLGNPLYLVYQTITDEQTAVFAQGDLHFAERFTATLGARVEEAKANQTNINGSGLFNSGVPTLVVSPTLKEHPILPKAALSYQADSNNLFYASVSKGLRIGGGNNGLASICGEVAPPTYKSDYLWSYEVGAKDKFFDGRLQVDTSAFHIKWSSIQASVLLACGLGYTANLADAVSNGFDMALTALLTDRLQLNFNVGYVDARYSTNAFNSTGQPLALRGEAVQALNFVNPPWDVTTALSYSIPLPNSDELHVRGQYLFHSRNPGPVITQVPTSPSYFPAEVPDPATHLVNARLGYTRGKMDIDLFVNNMFNSHPLLNAYQDTPTSNLVTYSTFRPRTVGVSFNYKLW